MKLTEIKKGDEVLERGDVFMVVEGSDEEVMKVVNSLKAFGYKAADITDGDVAETEAWFIVARSDLKAFKDFYKAAKKA